MKPVTEGDHCTGTSLSGDFGYPGGLVGAQRLHKRPH